jgi:hypothetical protein
LLVEQLMTFVIAYALILTVTYAVDSRDRRRLNMVLNPPSISSACGISK